MSEPQPPPEHDGPPAVRVFISYSRKDTAFVDRLEPALKARGIESLIDRHDIYAFEDWWQRIEKLIVQADTIVVVLSPDAVASDVCAREIAFATSLNKRFAPIVCASVDYNAVPETLRRLNFLAFDDDARFEDGATRLAEALRSDIDWIRKHTVFGEAAHRWSPDGRAGPRGLLLRSPLLEEAERWIASRPHGAPVPTATTQAFLAASRRETTRRRNILSASLAAGLVLSLGLAGLAYWQRGIANEQRQIATTEAARAERNFGAAKSTIDAVIFDLAQGLKDVEGMRAETARKILEQAERAIGQLAEQTNNDREVRRSQAHMFILFSETYASLGASELALDYAKKATDILRALAAEDSDNVERRRELSVGLDRVGAVLKDRGDLAGALAAYRESFNIRRELVAMGSNAQRRHDLFVSLTAIGEVLYADGDIEGALIAFRQALDIVRALVTEEPGNTQWQRELSANLGKIGDGLKDQGDLAGALDIYRRSLDIARALVAADPDNTEWRRDLSVSLTNVGNVLSEQNDLAGALAAYRESLDIMRALVAKDPGNKGWLRGVSVSLSNVGDVLKAQGDGAGALAAYREALDIIRALVAKDPDNTEWRRDLTVNLNMLGDTLKSQGDTAGAIAAYRESLAIRRELVAKDPGNAQWQADLVLALWRLARAGDDPRSRLSEALTILRRLNAENRLTPTQRGWIAAIEGELARL
jgi:tetratricopeptide (TPR) repeat protein